MEEIKTLKDAEFDALITLSIIERDKDLTSIFKEEKNVDFNILRGIIKEGLLKKDTESFLKLIFEKIILTKKEYIGRYLLLQNAEASKPVPVKSIEKELGINKILPRRYGKVEIKKEIERQGGKATNAQLTALDVNKLRNIYVNLNARLIKDMLAGQQILTDEDYRTIRSVITTVEQKLENILKKK